jgi:hypothetical protein
LLSSSILDPTSKKRGAIKKLSISLMLFTGIGLCLSMPITVGAQSTQDSAAVLRVLARTFASEGHGRIYLHTHMGEPKDYPAKTQSEKARQRALAELAAGANSSVVLYEQLPQESSPESRSRLYKYLASFRAGYRVLSIDFSATGATALVNRQVYFLRATGPVEYTRTQLRYDLSRRAGRWEVTKSTVLNVADGMMDN